MKAEKKRLLKERILSVWEKENFSETQIESHIYLASGKKSFGDPKKFLEELNPYELREIEKLF